jgi:C-5 cytosine-specific DNA methylase
MSAYYNEIDPLKAEIIREAIKAGAIAPGDVDERSIVDVEPAGLMGYAQCHFFAGGGFWSVALRQAGWPDDRPVWTGSCPCPSFSAAGKGQGFTDPRHLWPAWARLIRECRPPTIFGEQVSAAIGHGWLDLVQTDLEAQDYAVGKIVLGAASVGAPHIRQRLYFVGELANSRGAEPRRIPSGERKTVAAAGCASANSGMADAADARRQVAGQHESGQPLFPARSEQCGDPLVVAQSQCAAERRRGLLRSGEGCETAGAGTSTESFRRGVDCLMADTASSRCEPSRDESVEARPTNSRSEYARELPLRTPGCGADGIVVDAEGRGLGMCGSASRQTGHAAQPGEPSDVGDSAFDRNGTQHGQSRPSGGQEEPFGGPSVSDSLGESLRTRLEGHTGDGANCNQPGRIGENASGSAAAAGEPCGLANADGGNASAEREQRSGEQRQQPQDGGAGNVGDSKSERRQSGPAWNEVDGEGMESAKRESIEFAAGSEDAGSVAEPLHAEWGPFNVDGQDGRDGDDAGRQEAHNDFGTCGEVCRPSALNGFWRDADWIGCRDGKFRPVEPGSFPLAHGSAARVGRLRLYGDAICVPCATEFIKAYREIKEEVE